MSNVEHLANVMVQAFIDAVEQGVDPVPVVVDLTSTVKIAPFIKQLPGCLVNVGIAEQSMVGTAAGLALGGKVTVTCNAAPFLISRANERIKVDARYNNTNVKLLGLNVGASYGPLASTHHSIDDIAIMRGFGNIQIFVPSSSRECRQIIDYAIGYQGPVYTRLDGKALPELHDESHRFVPGAVLTLREGEHVTLVAAGSTVHEIVDVAALLADAGIQAKAVSAPSTRPCDTKALLLALQGSKVVITVEEHNINGGLGSLVAEVLAEGGVGAVPKRLGIPDEEYAAAAGRGWLRQHHGFDAAAIAAQARGLLRRSHCCQCDYIIAREPPLHAIRLMVRAEDHLVML